MNHSAIPESICALRFLLNQYRVLFYPRLMPSILDASIDPNLVSRVSVRNCEKILVIKLDRLGDFVMATPFLRALRKSAPGARIDLVVSPEGYAIAELCPYADRVLEFTKDGPRYQFRAANSFVGATFFEDFQAGDFDLALIPRWDYDFYGAVALAKEAKARNIVAFAKPATYDLPNYGEFCTETLSRPFLAHEIEHNLALLEFVGGSSDGSATEVWVNRDDYQGAAEKLDEAFGGEQFLAVFPGAAQPRRVLPPEKLGAILGAVRSDFPQLHFALLGSRIEANTMESAVAGLPKTVSLCGKITLREAIAVAGLSFAAVTMDSAPAHFVSAIGKPLVTFCCHPKNGDPTDAHSPARFGPHGSTNCAVLQPAEPLWPCVDRCRAPSPHCLTNFTEASAVRAISEVLQRAGLSPLTRSCLT